MYARPSSSTFGVSGLLWRDSLIMYDRDTGSLWSQVLGKAVAGPMNGQALVEVPSQLTSWGDWKQRHPDTLVLRENGRRRGSGYAGYHGDNSSIGIHGRSNPDERLPPKTLVYGMESNGVAAVASLGAVAGNGLVEGELAGAPVVVVAIGAERQTALAYSRVVDGRTLSFASVDQETVGDFATGSLWSRETGECLEGELAGKRLAPIKGKHVYWGVWVQFHPRTAMF